MLLPSINILHSSSEMKGNPNIIEAWEQKQWANPVQKFVMPHTGLRFGSEHTAQLSRLTDIIHGCISTLAFARMGRRKPPFHLKTAATPAT